MKNLATDFKYQKDIDIDLFESRPKGDYRAAYANDVRNY